jgi:hypothetical protein
MTSLVIKENKVKDRVKHFDHGGAPLKTRGGFENKEEVSRSCFRESKKLLNRNKALF